MVEISEIVEEINVPICSYVSGEKIRVPEMNACLCKYDGDCDKKHQLGNKLFCGHIYNIES
jgi:hypothetical protein